MDCIVYPHLTNFWQTSIKENLYLKTFLILLFKEIDPSLSIMCGPKERWKESDYLLLF